MKALFEQYDLRTLLRDLQSVKMLQADRARACALRGSVALSAAQVAEAWALVRRFRRQLAELHAARERARMSVGRERLGLARETVRAAQAARREAEQVEREDIGL